MARAIAHMFLATCGSVAPSSRCEGPRGAGPGGSTGTAAPPFPREALVHGAHMSGRSLWHRLCNIHDSFIRV